MGDTSHPFFRPLWRRILLVAFCVAWAGFELYMGSSFWATLVGGMAVLGAWQFLINYKPAPEPEAAKEVTDDVTTSDQER
ncbi:DUF3329 domain-containing protein [Corticibacterium sp. UT-5YL-CI-8]|nr:DUF3329 domain-containing protein [Tianweitania sp. UT-5YL-CI-8]